MSEQTMWDIHAGPAQQFVTSACPERSNPSAFQSFNTSERLTMPRNRKPEAPLTAAQQLASLVRLEPFSISAFEPGWR